MRILEFLTTAMTKDCTKYSGSPPPCSGIQRLLVGLLPTLMEYLDELRLLEMLAYRLSGHAKIFWILSSGSSLGNLTT